MATELLQLGFEAIGLHRNIAWCYARNVAPVELVTCRGARPESLFREHELDNGA